MGFLRTLGTMAGKALKVAGSIGGAVLRPLGAIAAPIAAAVNAAADVLPIPGAGMIKNAVNRAAEYIGSGRAAEAAKKVGRFGQRLQDLSSDDG
jgi:anthranilate phosphoribosyltransferase